MMMIASNVSGSSWTSNSGSNNPRSRSNISSSSMTVRLLEWLRDNGNIPSNLGRSRCHMRMVNSTPFVCRSYGGVACLEVSKRVLDRVDVAVLMVKIESNTSLVVVTNFCA